MSKRRRYALLLAIAIMAASGSLYGCGSSGGNTTAAIQTSVAKGDVTVKATFPGTAGATKSLIPTATKAIYVKFIRQDSQQSGTTTSYDLKLTVASPSGSIKLAPGNYLVNASAYDSDSETNGYPSGMPLATTQSGGVVNLGSNTVTLTFLNGTWTLDSPLVLSDGKQLNDILISSSRDMQKTAFDPTKPVGSGSGSLKYLFSNYTSATTTGSMSSQFIGTSNSIALSADSFNLTQKCTDSSYDQYMATPCEDKAGDQLIMVNGGNDSSGSYSSGGYYEGETLLHGSAYELLPGKGATSFTRNGTAIDLLSSITPSTVTGGSTISGSLMEVQISGVNKTLSTTVSPAKVATAKVVKAQSANTPYTGITVTDYDIKLCATKSNPSAGTWLFSGQPVTIGTATCYSGGYLSNYNSTAGQTVTPDAGDYSYGLAPTDDTKLGDYCHQWDYSTSTCLKQKPDTGDVYYPYSYQSKFIAKRTATKTTIDYGSFKLNFHIEKATSGTVYAYPFTAKGKAQ